MSLAPRRGMEFKKTSPSTRNLGLYYFSSRVRRVTHPYRRRVVNIMLWRWTLYSYLDMYE